MILGMTAVVLRGWTRGAWKKETGVSCHFGSSNLEKRLDWLKTPFAALDCQKVQFDLTHIQLKIPSIKCQKSRHVLLVQNLQKQTWKPVKPPITLSKHGKSKQELWCLPPVSNEKNPWWFGLFLKKGTSLFNGNYCSPWRESLINQLVQWDVTSRVVVTVAVAHVSNTPPIPSMAPWGPEP